ncbi:AraC family transcriptional regulator [Ensifer sp. Root31]|uniref:helix-turn-helix domain-containing protein n=1 Tax=Ensifer sp. Root31 TaxID=1736512 RepID=UPI0007C66C95|nr:AraC family transcriptional regulator [Ensifer sp. Root31]
MSLNVATSEPNSVFKTGSCRTISREKKSWDRVQAELVRRTGLEKEEIAITSDRHLVMLNVQGDCEQGQYFLDGKPTSFVRRKPGSILFVPAGCNWQGWEAGAPTAAYLSLSVDPSFVTDLVGRTTPNLQPSLSPDLGCEDPVLMNAARGIGAEIQDQGPHSGLLVESYVATIFAQLLRRQRYIPSVSKGGLTPASLNRVIEKIDENLDVGLSLSHLAEVVNLSIPHFCRAFKQSLGCPPYAFIIRRRIERAKEYLRHSSMSATDIALACGFSNSSHFSNAFRREVGMTPVAYRGAWPTEGTIVS